MATEESIVEYRDIPEHIGYRAGSDGSIWSRWVRQVRPRRLGDSWHRLMPQPNKDGHLTVLLAGHPHRPFFVHRLILEAFIGPCPPGMEARHFPDRNPANNCPSNLSWATPKTNQADRLVHGTHCRGSRCYAAKLTEDQVRQARAEYQAGGITQRQLAKKYGIRQGPMNNLLLRKSWADVL